MNAKEIGRTAGRIFGYRLPPNWILRSQEDQEDYGVDMEIEIASPDDKATGFIFKVQVKGQQHVKVINDGTQVSFDLSVERLCYYMRQMEVPIILAVVDVSDERIFWCSLQDNVKIAEDLEKAIGNGQKTVAVHLRVEDTLPERTSDLLGAVERNMDWLRLHGLDRLTGSIGEILSRSRDDVLDGLLDKGKKLHFEIYNQKFERLFASKNFSDLLSLTQTVIHSATELVETRLTAGLYIERLLRQEFERSDPRGHDSIANLHGTMLYIVRHERAPQHFQRYVLLLVRAMRMQVSVNSDYHYFVSAKQFPRESLPGWIIAATRLKVSAQASHDVVKTVHLVNRAVLAGQHGLLLDAISKIVPFMALFAHRLKEDGLTAQAETLSSWLQFCVDLAIDVARATNNLSALAEAIGANALIDLTPEGKATRIEKSLELAETIENATFRERIKERLRALAEQIVDDEKELTPDEEIEVFRVRALGLGIDVENPADEFGTIIKQGLIDYNPERVIKNCESLVMIPSRSLGVPAQMVGLRSAGMKFLYCLKKGHAVGGWRLDEVYDCRIPGLGFKSEYCDTCELRQARSDGWQWSSKWQRDLEEKHRNTFKKIGTF